jgi:Transcriptional regulatory protein, C terminal
VARHQGTVLLGITDAEQATLIARAAQQAQLDPTLAFTPAQLLTTLRRGSFDLVVLHPALIQAARMAPLPDFLEMVRARGCPVLLLPDGGRGAGAVASATEAIRRVVHFVPPRTLVEEAPRVCHGPLRLDTSRRQAWWSSQPLELTPAQFRILTVLADAAGAVVTNRELARRVWGSEGHLDGERIFAHIRRIRKKIETDPAKPRFLLTVRGEGFRLAA